MKSVYKSDNKPLRRVIMRNLYSKFQTGNISKCHSFDCLDISFGTKSFTSICGK